MHNGGHDKTLLSERDIERIILVKRHCERIIKKTKELDLESFLMDLDLKEIVCFNLLQIGELVKGLSKEFVVKYSQIPWKQIAGMRDRLAHGYETIRYKDVWYVVEFEIINLLNFCDEILNENSFKDN